MNTQSVATVAQNALAATLLSDYLTRPQLAVELGRDIRTLQRWAWQRKGPKFRRIGGRVLYHKDDVLAWIEAQPTSETRA